MSDDIISDEDIDFEKAYKESFKDIQEESIIEVTVVDISSDTVFLDFGYKSEAKVPCGDFEVLPKIGDKIKIYLVRLEGRDGQPVVSKKRYDYLNDREELRKMFNERKIIEGVIKEVRNNGCVLEYKSITGFMPYSLFDVVRRENFDDFINKKVKFYIERINFKDIELQRKQEKKDGEFLANRKKYIIEQNNILKNDFFKEKKDGDIIEGNIKAITDFGAFIDVGGVDALLRTKDVAWGRITEIDEVLKKNDKIKVKILNINKDLKKVTVGLKQLQDDPLDKFIDEHKIDDIVIGSVVSIVSYGAFVKIIDGVEGLLHISDLSWIKKIKNPAELVKVGQNLELKIIKIDKESKRIGLSLKHLLDNPWDSVEEKYKVGTIVKGKIIGVTTFGCFIELEEGIEALLHIDDVSWTRTIRNPYKYFKVGDVIESVVIQCDSKKTKIRLSVKKLTEDPWSLLKDNYSNGDIVSCVIKKIDKERGFSVKITEEIFCFIPLSHIGLEKIDDIKSTLKTEHKVGDEIKAIITNLDFKNRKINVSIKEYLKRKQRETVKEFLHDADEDAKYTLKDALEYKNSSK